MQDLLGLIGNRRVARALVTLLLAAIPFATSSAATPPSNGGSADPTTQRLIVKVTGLRNDRGEIQVALYHGGKGFPNEASDAVAHQSVRIAPGDETTITFTDLKSGEYAVALFHDENDNGTLDTSLGFPLEGFGVSDNPALHWRPPAYNESKFMLNRDHGADGKITIRIRYLTDPGTNQ